MDGRLLVATLALLTTALAGCLDAPGATADDGEVTALENLAVASAVAEEWNAGAELVSIFAVELAESDDPIPADPEVGNGEAPVWIFAYRTDAGDARAFLVLADGVVVEHEETYGAEAYEDYATPIKGIVIDSDAGLAVAATSTPFADALLGANLTLAEGVAHWDGRTAWYYAAMSATGAAVATVDAETGELLLVKEMGAMPDLSNLARTGAAYRPPGPVHLEETGKLDAQAPKAKFPFEYSGADGEGTLTLSVKKSLATDSIAWEIRDAEDERVASGSLGRAIPGMGSAESREFSFDLESPGEHTLILMFRPTAPVPSPSGSIEYAFKLHVGEEPRES